VSGAHERGFTVIEALVAAAILTLIALSGLAVCKTLAGVLASTTGSGRDAAKLDAQAVQFRNDAASAVAVFVPSSDTSGDGAPAQEVDFAAKTNAGRAIRWRYRYEPAKRTLTRWDYDADGTSGVRDPKTGLIDAAATYPPLRDVTLFHAVSLTADALADPGSNRYGAIGTLFIHPPRAVPIRYDDLGSVPTIGGNGVVEIALANGAGARVVHLVAGTLPAGFTVTGAPVWHAVVYRVDQSHRFLLGVAGKSHVFINAHVDVSYDHWATRTTWCDFNLFGNPDGLDPHDPHADYTPDDPSERSDAILAACRARHPSPPAREEAGNPPDVDAVHPPLPGQTAPPCWVQPGPGGRCWPANAPPDWSPPSPAPTDSPPRAWCATHAASPACAAAPG
jgi:hypothetical protein